MKDLGLVFTVQAPEVDEPKPLPAEDPSSYAQRLARIKAASVAKMHPNALIIAADTIVVVQNRHKNEAGSHGSGLDLAQAHQILGKPRNMEEALSMLKQLNGQAHTVITAVHMIWGQGDCSFADAATVRFHTWDEAVLAAYAKTGESLDKAGGYAIQGQGAFLVAAVEGAWSTVVGLPLTMLVEHLLRYGLMKAVGEKGDVL